MKICIVDTCDRATDKYDRYCGTHRARVTRHGDPLAHVPVRKKAASGEVVAVVERRLTADPSTWGDECWSWPYATSNGYAVIGTSEKVSILSRVAYSRTRGPIPDGLQVRHLCGNGAGGCWNPNHLELGTHQQNMDDKRIHGTHRALFTDDQVMVIRQRYAAGERSVDLGKEFGVGREHIWSVAKGKCYKHLPTVAAMVIWLAVVTWGFFLYTAPPASAQDVERCTVQTFDPPLESGWLMPGDADRVTITFVDGISTTLIGPFVLGDIITHPGQVAQSIRKCSGSGVPPTTPPAPTATPEPTPTPTAEPTVTATPIPEDQCCTTIVTPGPTPEPTPIIPGPPATPTPEYPEPTPIMTLTTATPTPAVPMLPNTGSATGPLVVAGLFAIFAGAMLLGSLRR